LLPPQGSIPNIDGSSGNKNVDDGDFGDDKE
jgi:hypothetical protein